NVRDGVHMGSLAGAWLAAVHGLGGMRHHGESLSFSPRLPPRIRRLTFRVSFLGRLIKVSLNHERTTYTLLRGRPITFDHFGERVRLKSRAAVIRAIPALPAPPQPRQPAARAPAGRRRPRPRRHAHRLRRLDAELVLDRPHRLDDVEDAPVFERFDEILRGDLGRRHCYAASSFVLYAFSTPRSC